MIWTISWLRLDQFFAHQQTIDFYAAIENLKVQIYTEHTLRRKIYEIFRK